MSEFLQLFPISLVENNLVQGQMIHTEKILGDLNDGFRLFYGDECGDQNEAYVVTRNGDDLFVVELLNINTNLERTYTRFDCTIRRRNILSGSGSHTLERWTVHLNNFNAQANGSTYTIQHLKCGKLKEAEFWQQYNASIPDKTLNQQYYDIIFQQKKKTLPHRIQFSMNWMANEK